MMKKIYYKHALPILRDMHTQWFTHPFTKYVKKTLGDNLVGAEIGVFKGENAKNMLSILNIKKLYLIDPYKAYNDASCSAYQMNENIKTQAQKRLSNYKNIKFIGKTSMDAIDDIPNNLDFIYIDGDHTYNGVKTDVMLYWSKIKVGGIMGGDDFTLGHVGLINAVIEFVNKHNLKLEGVKENWWIIKK